MNKKQAGNSISRSHTWGSKIAQGLQNVNYVFLQYPINPKVGPIWWTLSNFSPSIVAKYQKIEGGPLETSKFSKMSHNAEKTERGTFQSRLVWCYAEKDFL